MLEALNGANETLADVYIGQFDDTKNVVTDASPLVTEFTMGDILSLSDLPRELHQFGITTSYHKIWRAANEGRIPAERIGTRWMVWRKDLPAIVAAFTPADV